MGGAIPGLVVLGSIRKQTEKTMGSKPVNSSPPWPLYQLLWCGKSFYVLLFLVNE